jgi:hypothetical protein
MARAKHSEVAMIECSKLRFIETLNNGKHGRVNKAYV